MVTISLIHNIRNLKVLLRRISNGVWKCHDYHIIKYEQHGQSWEACEFKSRCFETSFCQWKIGAKANLTKWREEQSSVLVDEWKELRIEEVESSRATETWRQILNAVNKAWSPKTVKQCKDKIRNLKQAYKEAKGNNNLTRRSPKTSPHYDSFDEVLGTRAVVTMPGVIQSDQVKSEASSDSTNTSEAALNYSEEDSDGSVQSDSSATSSETVSKRKKRVPQKARRKAKKGWVTAATVMVDLTGKLVEMQSS